MLIAMNNLIKFRLSIINLVIVRLNINQPTRVPRAIGGSVLLFAAPVAPTISVMSTTTAARTITTRSIHMVSRWPSGCDSKNRVAKRSRRDASANGG